MTTNIPFKERLMAYMQSDSESLGIRIIPNPLAASFIIGFPNNIVLKDAVLKIYDLRGREVKNILLNSHTTIIDKSDLKNGLFFYSILNNNEKIANGKLIVQSD